MIIFLLPSFNICFGCSEEPRRFFCVSTQGFSLASAIGHSPKIVPDVRECCQIRTVCPRRFLEMHAVWLCTVMK